VASRLGAAWLPLGCRLGAAWVPLGCRLGVFFKIGDILCMLPYDVGVLI